MWLLEKTPRVWCQEEKPERESGAPLFLLSVWRHGSVRLEERGQRLGGCMREG